MLREAQNIFASAEKIKVGTGEWAQLLQRRFFCRVTSGPKINRLSANQNIGFAGCITNLKDSAELFERETHRCNQAQRAIARMTWERLVMRPFEPSATA